ncbi:hypothetical protein AR457_41690 (plasmid) [Streptomyces agglomeratus]|uniref:hypothetical protein n=1 Tax=Streptomyces agglomeratus TaxID=285458 RepID=UPI0008541EDE|nr:hypothetical protein [Streptomyces agglomeratus]OEJ20792.1 hypothetical protein AR457_41690 [Streptomyces agglomeratus]
MRSNRLARTPPGERSFRLLPGKRREAAFTWPQPAQDEGTGMEVQPYARLPRPEGADFGPVTVPESFLNSG